MKFALIVLLLTCASLTRAAVPNAAPTAPQSSAKEEEAVLAAIQAFFAAVEAKDQAMMLAAVMPDGLATSVRVDQRQQNLRNWHWTRYWDNVAAQGRFTERMTTPKVFVERDIAMVWGRYELLIDGVFTQCGVNHFDMVKSGGKWLIYNLTWTNQRVGCPGR